MRRLLSTLIPLLAVMAMALPAQGAYTWCRSDPAVKLNGTQVQVIVAIPTEYEKLVSGPYVVTVGTPSTVRRSITYLHPLGLNGKGEEVKFVDITGTIKAKKFPAKFSVTVPIDSSGLPEGTVVPIQMTVKPANATPLTVQGDTTLTSTQLTITGQ